MDAKAFRLGNYYLENGVIETITPSVIKQIFESEDRIWFEPIKVSKDLILKLGFKRFNSNIYWFSKHLKNGIKLNVSEIGYIEIEDIDRTTIEMSQICEYVHQLQNLYFALCGEELVFSTEP